MPTLNADGRAIHYVETGAGPPALVLVHGAGGSAGTWVRQLEDLADVARVVALDLPGHGASPGPGCREVGAYAAAVAAFVQALGAGPVVLGGHSMGGAITQTVALVAPDLLRGIVLVGTGARLKVFPKIFELMGRDHAAGVDFVNDYAWSPAAAPALKEAGRRALLATPAAVTLGDFTGCNVFDVMERLAEIRLPALVIVGDDDQLTPPKYAEHLARAIAGARLVRIPAAGHYVMLEQPEDLSDAVRTFLAGLAPRPRAAAQ
jgi:pimeloyl-ACP methyl ester carboxylesterase